jgi:hypothetical protein
MNVLQKLILYSIWLFENQTDQANREEGEEVEIKFIEIVLFVYVCFCCACWLFTTIVCVLITTTNPILLFVFLGYLLSVVILYLMIRKTKLVMSYALISKAGVFIAVYFITNNTTVDSVYMVLLLAGCSFQFILGLSCLFI